MLGINVMRKLFRKKQKKGLINSPLSKIQESKATYVPRFVRADQSVSQAGPWETCRRQTEVTSQQFPHFLDLPLFRAAMAESWGIQVGKSNFIEILNAR